MNVAGNKLHVRSANPILPLTGLNLLPVIGGLYRSVTFFWYHDTGQMEIWANLDYQLDSPPSRLAVSMMRVLHWIRWYIAENDDSCLDMAYADTPRGKEITFCLLKSPGKTAGDAMHELNDIFQKIEGGKFLDESMDLPSRWCPVFAGLLLGVILAAIIALVFFR